MAQGEWLVLSSANYFLDDVKDLCELQGWYFSHKHKNSIKLDLLLAIQAWEKWRTFETTLPVASIKNIYTYLGENVTKKTAETLTPFFHLDLIKENSNVDKKPWYFTEELIISKN